jgi:hypothetical protein
VREKEIERNTAALKTTWFLVITVNIYIVYRTLFNKMKQRQCRFIGHVMHVEGLENLVTTGKIHGKRDKGRQRDEILDGAFRWLGVKDNKDIFRDVRDRTRWRNYDDDTLLIHILHK